MDQISALFYLVLGIVVWIAFWMLFRLALRKDIEIGVRAAMRSGGVTYEMAEYLAKNPPPGQPKPLEICENCRNPIGALEAPFLWHNHIVCRGCHERLQGGAERKSW